MVQRAPFPENGSFVQAGYPNQAAEPADGREKSTAASAESVRNSENKSEESAGREPTPANGGERSGFDRRELLSRLRLSNLDSGDLLLAAILYFTLHDTGDDDLFWIAAILFLTGKGTGER